MESTNSKVFNWILGLSALAISGMAAFFSVTGIAMLLAMVSVLTLLPKLILIAKPFGNE